MEIKDMIAALVDIHNTLVDVNVHGDDTIRMAGVLQKCRAIILQAQKELGDDADGVSE